ncbi:MAG: Fumarate reductase respiratory complex, transrane subunit, partial [Deltaproteobacteria bacterium]|nr:Fumarate reductase respiratory complex, transrane subunit [Deltaproteobacteria bacterium]
MNQQVDVIAGTGLDLKARKSHWPARLDFVQSASGLLLGLFMWGHMAFVSTILISNDAMYWVTKMFEGEFILGKAYSGIVAAVVAVVSFLFVLHGLLAMRKFPGNFQEYRSFASHRQMLRHEDTTLWWVQAWTGFALFFLASVHLYQMLMNPGAIGPYESAERVWSGGWWPLYLILLFAVE